MLELKGKNNSYKLVSGLKDILPQKNGKFGSLVLAQNSDGDTVLIKRIVKTDNNAQAGLAAMIREVKYTPKGEYFLKPIDFFEVNNSIFLVRPFEAGISLKEVLEEKVIYKKISLPQKLQIGLETLKALSELEKRGIVHKDIRPANILLLNIREFTESSKKVTPKIKIIDFGLAQALSEKIPPETRFPFSLIYSPPEQLLNLNHLIGHYSDLYAWAITMYEFFSGDKPWYSDNPEFLMNMQLNLPIPESAKISKELFEVLKKASYKVNFGKPPARLHPEQIASKVCLGINERYQQASQIIEILNIQINNLHSHELSSKKKWYQLFFKKIKTSRP